MITRSCVMTGIALAVAALPAAAETTSDCLAQGLAASRAGDPARAVALYREALSRPICQATDIEPLVRFNLARTLLTVPTPDAHCAASDELRRVVAASADAEVRAAAAMMLDAAKARCLTAAEPAPTAAATPPSVTPTAPPMAPTAERAPGAPPTDAAPPMASSPAKASGAPPTDARPPMASSPAKASGAPPTDAAPSMAPSPVKASGAPPTDAAPPMASSPAKASGAPMTDATPPLAPSPMLATGAALPTGGATPMPSSPAPATRAALPPDGATPMASSPSPATGAGLPPGTAPPTGRAPMAPPSHPRAHATLAAIPPDRTSTAGPAAAHSGDTIGATTVTHPSHAEAATPGSRRATVGARFEIGKATFLGIDPGSVELTPEWGNRVGLVFEWSPGGRTSVRVEPGLAWQRVRFSLDDWELTGIWRWWLAELPVLARVVVAGDVDLCAGLGGAVVLAADERWEGTGAPLDGARAWSLEGLLGVGYGWTLGAMRLRAELRGGAGLVGVNVERDAADLRAFRLAIGVETLF